jgi:uncharacterized protein (TIGR03437 family)
MKLRRTAFNPYGLTTAAAAPVQVGGKGAMRASRVTVLFLLAISLLQVRARSDTNQLISKSSAGITVTVSALGSYIIAVQDPPWSFAGDVGQPVTSLALANGNDAVGSYQEISFSYTDTAARQAAIRNYIDKPIVLFTARAAAGAPDLRFPTLAYSQGLNHLAYVDTWAHYDFTQLPPDSPWLFFDDSANAFLLSAASHFQVAGSYMTGERQITAGIDPRIGGVPAGFTHRTILVVSKGINRTFDIWGRALTDLRGKTRPPNDADVTLSSLGYWTDRGSQYYYSYDPALGYAGTLLAVRDDFARLGIPLGYMQLDSWFYPKGPNADWNDGGGIYLYEAAPALFPQGLKAFREQLGLPLVTHARWIDASSPYHQQYQFSGNVSVDPRYWADIMGYLADARVAAYEQDWLNEQAQTADTLDDPDAFLDNMAQAAAANGLTIQYCMAMPHDFLYTTKYNNVTTLRVSSDRYDRSNWNAFLYTSRFASAIGVWPWSDVFMSPETENVLLATLSAGVVGVGDAIGQLNKANLMRVIRGDGLIVKPDSPLVPLDDAYVHEAKHQTVPMQAAAVTDFGGWQARYLIAYDGGPGAAASFRPASLGFSGSTYVYNYFTGSGRVVDAQDTYTEAIGNLNYYVAVPIGASGIAFLGDTGHFVPLGKKRIAQVADSGVLQATVLFAAGEKTRTLRGYAPAAPGVSAVKGSAGAVSFDAGTHLFSVPVSADVDGTAVVLFCEACADANVQQAGVVNAATFAGPVAPGSIATLFGLRLAAAPAVAMGTSLPASLAGAQVSVAGVPAPQFYASPTQINFQVPWETPAGTVSVRVSSNGQAATAGSLAVASVAPGVFTFPRLAPKQAAALIAGTALLATASSADGRPALPGQYISIFCTGLGPVDHTPPTGAPAPYSPLARITGGVEVSIGGQPAEVSFAGLAPGSVGLYQVNARVPDGVAAGEQVPLVLTVAGSMANPVTIAVGAPPAAGSPPADSGTSQPLQ